MKNKSLKVKLLLIMSAVTVALSLCAFLVMNTMSSKWETQTTADFTNNAVSISDSIEAQFFERYGDVQAFALNPIVKNFDAKTSDVLDQMVALYGIYDLIVVLDANGNFKYSNTKTVDNRKVDIQNLKSYDFKAESWFKAAINGEFSDDKDNAISGTHVEAVSSESLLEKAFGKKQKVSSFTTTIKDESGKVVGVISNKANLKWIGYDVENKYKDLDSIGLHTADFTILNKDGSVIFALDPAENKTQAASGPQEESNLINEKFEPALLAAKGQHGAGFYDRENIPHVIGYAPVDGNKSVKSLGWTVLVGVQKSEIMASLVKIKTQFTIILFIVSILTFLASWVFSEKLSKSILKQVTELDKNSLELLAASQKIASSSTELSQSSTEQAAALQETMAAVDQISATVQKNADSAKQSKHVSQQSQEAAHRGKDRVDTMMNSMQLISSANDRIASEVEQSHKQFSEIVRLFNDIGNKTKAINEIVFQTKLLSFNASVEAARAGEYGKGFAVVAEEVGNLAQMSGAAAKDISEMLESSTKKVDEILKNTQTQVSQIINNSKEKVTQGLSTAEQCADALSEILKNVSDVDTLISEISIASQEQSQGVQEISKAIGQLDIVTQQNNAVAIESSSSAESIHLQADRLKHVIGDLNVIVKGTNQIESSATHAVNDKTISSANTTSSKSESTVIQFKPKIKSTLPSAQDTKKIAVGDITNSNDPRFEDI